MIDIQTDEKAIFLDALDCTSADEIKRFLDKACGSDYGLRRRVEKLLQAHRQAGAFLGGAAENDSPCDTSTTQLPGTRIGPYLLREQIGEGGMGLVFVADQEHPVRRRVALKVVKPGMDTRQVLARFEAERQALALMDHPNIAKVLDGGTIGAVVSSQLSVVSNDPTPPPLSKGRSQNGRPYFVMELVRGVPITDYCDSARLTTRQRLELFLPVCRAIQHAHQKGIIHRDIKPSNLLVTLYDSHPVPKVIDFGIAKAVGTAFANHSVYTGFAQLIGTPMYMSPEQAEMTAQDVDTRADVYALGVVLYELLTGTTPFEGEVLLRAGFDEMRRIIREDEPARPSHRVTTLSAEKQTTVTGQRCVDSRQLGRQLRGGLDWVVMTCLAKDRTHRYESAGALAADIERYLRDEAVEACPPTTGYRVWTFVRRHRRMLAVAGLIAVALVTATTVSMWQAVKARDAQHEAEGAKKQALTDASIARAVSSFLQDDLLSLVSPVKQLDEGFKANPNLTVRETLDRAAARIDERFLDKPLVEAEIRMTIGNAYRSIWDQEKAISHLNKAIALYKTHIGPTDRITHAAVLRLARYIAETGRYDEALAIFADWEQHFYEVVSKQGTDAIPYFGEYAWICYWAGKYDQAEQMHYTIQEIHRKSGNPTCKDGGLDTLIWLSRVHVAQKKYMIAEAEARAALKYNDQNRPWVRYVNLSMLGAALLGQGNYADAEPLLLMGYEGLFEWASSLGMLEKNWRLIEAIEKIVWFYEAVNQPDKTNTWRKKLSTPLESGRKY